MEIQFQATAVPYLKTVIRQTQTQEETQQLRLPDNMPDVDQVLACWGHVQVRSKEWRTGSINVSAGVTVWLLYAPSDGSAPRCVDAWLPMQFKWDIPESDRDGIIHITPMLRAVDARALSDRKLMLRAVVGLQLQAYRQESATVYTPDEMPEDVQILTNSYPMMLPVEAGEKAFQVEEPLSDSLQSPVKMLLRYALKPTVTETRIIADKIVLRALADFELVYMDEQDQIRNRHIEVPISQYIQLDAQYPADTEVKITFVTTGLELENSEQNATNLRFGLCVQYVISMRRMVDVTEDIYSPFRQTEPVIQQLELPAVLDVQNISMRAEAAPEAAQMRIVDAVHYMDEPSLHNDGEQMQLEFSGAFQLLCIGPDGELCTKMSRWENSRTIEVSSLADAQLDMLSWDKLQCSETGVRADIFGDLTVIAAQPVNMLSGAQLGEAAAPDPNRPSLILQRAETKTLWHLAKEHGSTVEAIKAANGLAQEPDQRQMLLIPVK